nr:PREDICTED: interferon-induced transmembrane protein 5 [Struthio camelus australis]
MDTSYPREDYLPVTSHKRDPSPTVITIGSSVVPRDHLIWSVFNTIYMNFCCLGFVALAFSVKLAFPRALRVPIPRQGRTSRGEVERSI